LLMSGGGPAAGGADGAAPAAGALLRVSEKTTRARTATIDAAARYHGIRLGARAGAAPVGVPHPAQNLAPCECTAWQAAQCAEPVAAPHL